MHSHKHLFLHDFVSDIAHLKLIGKDLICTFQACKKKGEGGGVKFGLPYTFF